MKSVIMNQYTKHYFKIYAFLLLTMFSFYISKILGGAGGDLMFRVSEAKYFLNGINPYDVYVGKVSIIEGFGSPNAYSFFSYYFASALSLFDNVILQKIVFSLIDIFALVLGLSIIGKMSGEDRNLVEPLIIFVLLMSVFFWQHVTTLNYNVIVTLGLLLTFYGIHRDSVFIGVLGVIIVGLKPSFAIPVFVFLLFSGKWKILLYSISFYLVALLGAAYWVDTRPLDLILQLKKTQSSFTSGHAEGFFFFLKGILGDKITLVGVLVSSAVVVFLRKLLVDPVNALIIVIVLGVSLFYNQVHAWIIVYPLLAYSILKLLSNRLSATPSILLLLFLLLPRMAGLFNQQYLDYYVSVHNVIRFGMLYLSAYLLIMNRHDDIGCLCQKSQFQPGSL